MRVSAGRSHLISASLGFTVSGTPLRSPTRSRNGWISLKRVEETEHTCADSIPLGKRSGALFQYQTETDCGDRPLFPPPLFRQKKKFQKKSVAGGGAAADDSVVGPGRSLNMNMNRRGIVQFCKKRSARRPDGKK